jgi:hypothetical protein
MAGRYVAARSSSSKKNAKNVFLCSFNRVISLSEVVYNLFKNIKFLAKLCPNKLNFCQNLELPLHPGYNLAISRYFRTYL